MVISGVVIANPKSIINKSKAPGKIKCDIFRYDQLIEVIKNKINYYKKQHNISEDRMKRIGEFFIINNKSIRFDYDRKYGLTEQDFMEEILEEKVKPYFIYTNEMMEEIIRVRLKDKKELIEIKGFGPVKIDKYGQDIVDIVKE